MGAEHQSSHQEGMTEGWALHCLRGAFHTGMVLVLEPVPFWNLGTLVLSCEPARIHTSLIGTKVGGRYHHQSTVLSESSTQSCCWGFRLNT